MPPQGRSLNPGRLAALRIAFCLVGIAVHVEQFVVDALDHGVWTGIACGMRLIALTVTALTGVVH